MELDVDCGRLPNKSFRAGIWPFDRLGGQREETKMAVLFATMLWYAGVGVRGSFKLIVDGSVSTELYSH